MYTKLKTYCSIFAVILHRDLKSLTKNLHRTFLDSLAILITNIIAFGGFLPAFGLPSSMIGPVFIGSFASLLFFLGFTFTFKKSVDLEKDRFIDYQLTLPLPNGFIFAEYILFFIIESAIIILPLVVLGIYLLRDKMSNLAPNPFLFLLMLFLALLVSGSFFLMLSFVYDHEWLKRNAWPRRLSPLFVLSANVLTWESVNNFSPLFGKILLLNPFTYLAEGLRTTLLANHQNYLPLNLIIPVALGTTILCVIGLSYGIKKRIDPV